MFRVAICDDDVTSLEVLYHQAVGFFKARGEVDFLVRRFQAVYDLLECLENPNLYFDLYLLDVVMPMYSGIEVGRIIREMDEHAMIVYTTAWEEYALDAISTEPLNYLLKPIDPDAVARVLENAVNRVDKPTRRLLVRRKEGYVSVGFHRIEYVEYRSHALTFHLNDGREITSRILQQSFSKVAEEALNDDRFIRTHAAYIANMDRVSAIDARAFTMESGAEVPISKRNYLDVKQKYLQYMVEIGGASVL